MAPPRDEEAGDDSEQALAEAEKWFAAEMEMQDTAMEETKPPATEARSDDLKEVAKPEPEKHRHDHPMEEEEKPAVDSKEESKQEKESATEAVMMEEKTAEGKVLDEAEEMQGDAPEDPRPRLKTPIEFNRAHASPNALFSADGRLLMTLCDGGFQYLLAGARVNAGVKEGRYMFEVRIVEMLGCTRGTQQDGAFCSLPRSLVRVGFAASCTSVLLDREEVQVFVDSEGVLSCNGVRQGPLSKPFGRGQTVAVVLERGPDSAGSIAAFCDGVCICPPRRLPESFLGKALYATVAYKNVTLQVNFGPAPLRELPFRCRMLNDAAEADMEVAPIPAVDRCEVIFPIGLPDEGIFAWLDDFLEKHPEYVELSDRKVLDWAKRSMLARPRGYESRESTDKPGMDFGVPSMDDLSVQKVFGVLAPALRRNFVVMELKSNLTAEDRRAALAQFSTKRFRRVAVVAMGAAPEEIKARLQATQAVPDLSPSVLASLYAGFSLPGEDEGFDEIRYVWQDAAESAAYFRSWILGCKKTHVAENLEPSSWFKEKWSQWQKALAGWKKKQGDFKAFPGADQIKMDIDADVNTYKSIMDIGDKMPLFADFEYEDWVLLGLRYELSLLVHAFKRDLDDPDRPSFREAHLPYYYEKYIGKALSLKAYNVESIGALLDLVPDAARLDKETQFLEVLLADDTPLEKFVRLTEAQRRERMRCIEAGDETAGLKFPRPPAPKPAPPKTAPPSFLLKAMQAQDKPKPVQGSPSAARDGAGQQPRGSAGALSRGSRPIGAAASSDRRAPPGPGLLAALPRYQPGGVSSQKRPYPGGLAPPSRTPPPPPGPRADSSAYPPSKQPRYGASQQRDAHYEADRQQSGYPTERSSARSGGHGGAYASSSYGASYASTHGGHPAGASYGAGRPNSMGSSQGGSYSSLQPLTGGAYGAGRPGGYQSSQGLGKGGGKTSEYGASWGARGYR